MELPDYVRVLRARWRLIVTCLLLSVTGAVAATALATPIYEAQTSAFVSTNDGANVGTAYTGGLYSQQRAKSYLDVVKSTALAKGVIADLGLSMTPAQVAQEISAEVPLDTVLIKLTVADSSPLRAQQIANALVRQLSKAVARLESAGNSTPAVVTVTQVEPAALPSAPVSPRPLLNLSLGLLVGLVLGVGVAVLLETLDTRIKSVEVLERTVSLPTLGVIARDDDMPRHPLAVQVNPHSGASESFRQLRTNLQFVDVDHAPRSIVVTSAVPNEGKSIVATNLALSLAQQGVPVILLDGDLRLPSVAEYLGIEGGVGFTDVLIGKAELQHVLQRWGGMPNLRVLTSGGLPPNPSELLASHQMGQLLRELETMALLIIDAPPLLPVTDASVLAAQASGVVLVVRAHKTRREQLLQAATTVRSVGGRVFGTVYNMAPSKGPDAYRYGYGYGYGGKQNREKPRTSAARNGSREASGVPVIEPAGGESVLPRRS